MATGKTRYPWPAPWEPNRTVEIDEGHSAAGVEIYLYNPTVRRIADAVAERHALGIERDRQLRAMEKRLASVEKDLRTLSFGK